MMQSMCAFEGSRPNSKFSSVFVEAAFVHNENISMVQTKKVNNVLKFQMATYIASSRQKSTEYCTMNEQSKHFEALAHH